MAKARTQRTSSRTKIIDVPLPDINIPTTVLNTTSGELRIVVPEELRGEAMFLIKKYMKLSGFDREKARLDSFIKGEAKLYKRTLTKTMFFTYYQKLYETCRMIRVEKEIESFVENIASKFVHCRYLLFTGFVPKKALVALIQEPPQITFPEFGQFVKPAPYINVSFIPTRLASGKIHAPIVAKFFFSLFKAYVKYRLKNLLVKYPRLHSLYNQIISRYRQRGKSEEHARKLALRDVLRVLIGNMWLVWTYVAYNRGVIKIIDIPKHIMHDLSAMINPAETILPERYRQFEAEADVNLKDITWRWLIDIYQEQERKSQQ